MKEIIIKSVDLGSLKKGKPAVVFLKNGAILSTSNVKSYFVHGGYVRIETQNTIYKNK